MEINVETAVFWYVGRWSHSIW